MRSGRNIWRDDERGGELSDEGVRWVIGRNGRGLRKWRMRYFR